MYSLVVDLRFLSSVFSSQNFMALIDVILSAALVGYCLSAFRRRGLLALLYSAVALMPMLLGSSLQLWQIIWSASLPLMMASRVLQMTGAVLLFVVNLVWYNALPAESRRLSAFLLPFGISTLVVSSATVSIIMLLLLTRL